jgi:GNAT superfamily N-acetyltransferase
MDVSIRRARAGDEKKVAELLLKLVEQHVDYDPERFSNFVTLHGAAEFYKSRFDVQDAAVLVAEVEDRIVGFAYIEFEKLDYESLLENAAWLHDIFVERGERSDGVGKRLLEAARNAASELGAGKLLLTVAAKNDVAQDFFEKAGFRQTMLEMTLNLK